MSDFQTLTPHAAHIKFLTHRNLWLEECRANQLPPNEDWDYWVYLAGRGNGKTRLMGEHWAWKVWKEPNVILHVVAPTHGDLRTVLYEGESGLLNIIPQECIRANGYNRSLGEIYLTNGSVIRGFSAEVPDRFRGPQCHYLWGDEVASWDRPIGNAQDAFDMAMFGLRLGEHAQASFSTTPKPIAIIKNLANAAKGMYDDNNKHFRGLRIVMTTGTTRENFTNLAPNFKAMVAQYEGTRLGRQELEAEILTDIAGALWTGELIDRAGKCDKLPGMMRIVVAIDPAATSGDNSNETGIITAGLGDNRHGYVMEDNSGKYKPGEWAKEAIKQYYKYNAEAIVAEVNNGGEMVEATIRSLDQNVNFKAVKASRGKFIRAEPVAALYERNLIHHYGGPYKVLEDQMLTLTKDQAARGTKNSPDRLDALVWAFNELMLGEEQMGILEFYQDEAERLEMLKRGIENPEMVLMRVPSGMSTYNDRYGKTHTANSKGLIFVPKVDVNNVKQYGFVEAVLEE
jgi:phage terminase large subunit-like protein